MKRILCSCLLLSLVMFMAFASGSSEAVDDGTDTITALLPPISNQFLSRIDEVEAAFHEKYPDLYLEIEAASWDDRIEKLDTMINAGTPPDIAFLGSEYVSKYVDMGVALDLTNFLTEDMISDFQEAPLNYMRNGDGIYGLPAYMEIHGLGANKEYLELLGVDYKTIQTSGWEFDEFLDVVSRGVGVKGKNSEAEYGLIWATTGSTTKNFIEIFGKNAGMPSEFDENHKYTYTSTKFLEVLRAAEKLMDNGAFMNASAGERWNMFLSGDTVFTGKGLANFENNAALNNEKILAGTGDQVADSVLVDYVVMPVPTLNGADPAYYCVVDGYLAFRGREMPSDEHISNVAKAIYFLASGSNAAQINSELFAVNITNSANEAAAEYPYERDADNYAANMYLMAHAAPARPDIPAELSAEATKIMDTVIIPSFQALLAREMTAEEMFETVRSEAIARFGEDGCVLD